MTGLADTFPYLGPVNSPSYPVVVSATAPTNPGIGNAWLNKTVQSNGNTAYMEMPRGIAEYVEFNGFVQHNLNNYVVGPYVRFADGHEINFAQTTNFAHVFHTIDWDGGGVRALGGTFISTQNCRWTFKQTADYDVKAAHPLFFRWRMYRVGEYWEFDWSGEYYSANGTPMNFSGGGEYHYNSDVVRMGVRGYAFNSDSMLSLTTRLVVRGT